MRNLFLLFMLMSNLSLGQTKQKILTTFASGIVYNNQSGIGVQNSIGFATTTGIELQSSKNITFFCGFDFQTLAAKKQGTNYSLEGSLSIIPLNCGIILKFPHLKFTPYLKAGGGVAIVSTPNAEINNNTTFIQLKSDTRISPILQGGFGLEWNFKPTLFPFIEIYSLHTMSESDIQNVGLWVFPLVFGLKMQM